jgi:CMP-N-acetylneuraminic acid synthetase
VNLERVQQFSLEQLERLNMHPDLLVHLEVTFPFRDEHLLDDMIEFTTHHGYDSVIACRRESGFLWQEQGDGHYKRIDSGDVLRTLKEKSYVGLHGLACVTHPEFIRQGSLMGDNIGLFRVDNPLSYLEIRDAHTSRLAEKLLSG